MLVSMLLAVALFDAADPAAVAPTDPSSCDVTLQICDVIDPATGEPRVWPRDVAKFQTDVEPCIHFAGEEPCDAARRRQIEAAIRKHCGPAERDGARLRTKYAKTPPVLDRVNAIQALNESAL